MTKYRCFQNLLSKILISLYCSVDLNKKNFNSKMYLKFLKFLDWLWRNWFWKWWNCQQWITFEWGFCPCWKGKIVIIWLFTFKYYFFFFLKEDLTQCQENNEINWDIKVEDVEPAETIISNPDERVARGQDAQTVLEVTITRNLLINELKEVINLIF